MKTAFIVLGALAGSALLAAAPALAQQSPPDRAPSRLQAEVAAEMTAPAPYGVPGQPYVSPIPRGNSQTFGNGPAPSFRVLNFPVGVDAGVQQPYTQSWFDNFGGQPASSNGGELLARASGYGAPGSGLPDRLAQ